ncbi:hypothetical protein C0995_006824 [Termitomyces sp. Mi166|nr:hypothetical protein C0995_006824 [Termitomyces sp. Mi166\
MFDHNPNAFSGQHHDSPSSIEVDGEDHYEVEKILDSCTGPDDTWKPFENLRGAADVVRDFHRLSLLSFTLPTPTPPPTPI